MTNPQENSQTGHIFRASPFKRVRAYWLDGDKLHWRIGSRLGHVPLSDIAFMRLNLAKGTNAAARCLLIERSGRKHRLCDRYFPRWTKQERGSWGRLQRREETFRNLTFTLARRLKKANPAAVIESGPSRAEWLASCLVALAAVAVVVGGAFLMVVQGTFAPAAATFMALVAVCLPMLWPVIRSGGPAALDPDTLN